MRHISTNLSTLFLATTLWSCGPNHTAEAPQPPAAPETTVAPEASAAPCAERMKDFLRWYARRFERNDTSTLFINFPLLGDEDSATMAQMRGNISSTKYMQLNRRKLAVFLDTLRHSGYFSAHYLAEKRASILQSGQALEALKLEDGVPDGFDADEVLDAQDIYNLQDIGKVQAYNSPNLKPGTQAYRLQLSPEFSWYFYLKQENGRCVLDSIAHD